MAHNALAPGSLNLRQLPHDRAGAFYRPSCHGLRVRRIGDGMARDGEPLREVAGCLRCIKHQPRQPVPAVRNGGCDAVAPGFVDKLAVQREASRQPGAKPRWRGQRAANTSDESRARPEAAPAVEFLAGSPPGEAFAGPAVTVH